MFDGDYPTYEQDSGFVLEPQENQHNFSDVNDGEAEINSAENPESSAVTPVQKRRIIRQPRVKLNPDRLCGERGIPIIMDHFKDLKFKGIGHEAENLDCLLSKLELWTHRLYPSMNMKDTLYQIEKLGKKKPVQVCLQKIRLDMPLISRDFVAAENDDIPGSPDPDMPPDMAFEQFLRDHLETNLSEVATENIFIPTTHLPTEVTQRLELSDAQLQRMEQNKKIAAEKLKAGKSNTSAVVVGVQNNAINEHKKLEENPSAVENSFDFSDEDDFDIENFQKPAKRLRIEDSDDDNLDIDALVELEDEEKKKFDEVDRTIICRDLNEESVSAPE